MTAQYFGHLVFQRKTHLERDETKTIQKNSSQLTLVGTVSINQDILMSSPGGIAHAGSSVGLDGFSSLAR